MDSYAWFLTDILSNQGVFFHVLERKPGILFTRYVGNMQGTCLHYMVEVIGNPSHFMWY